MIRPTRPSQQYFINCLAVFTSWGDAASPVSAANLCQGHSKGPSIADRGQPLTRPIPLACRCTCTLYLTRSVSGRLRRWPVMPSVEISASRGARPAQLLTQPSLVPSPSPVNVHKDERTARGGKDGVVKGEGEGGSQRPWPPWKRGLHRLLVLSRGSHGSHGRPWIVDRAIHATTRTCKKLSRSAGQVRRG